MPVPIMASLRVPVSPMLFLLVHLFVCFRPAIVFFEESP